MHYICYKSKLFCILNYLTSFHLVTLEVLFTVRQWSTWHTCEEGCICFGWPMNVAVWYLLDCQLMWWCWNCKSFSSFPLFFLSSFLSVCMLVCAYALCVHVKYVPVCVCMCLQLCRISSDDNLRKWGLSFYCFGTTDQTLVVKLGGKNVHIHLLSHLFAFCSHEAHTSAHDQRSQRMISFIEIISINEYSVHCVHQDSHVCRVDEAAAQERKKQWKCSKKGQLFPRGKSLANQV